MQRMRWGIQSAMTNKINLHTLSIHRVHLVTTIVAVTNSELIKITGDVISCP